jgi:hypothetical protein
MEMLNVVGRSSEDVGDGVRSVSGGVDVRVLVLEEDILGADLLLI